MTADLEVGRPPHQLRPDLWLFPPNRDCQGGSSWWLQRGDESVLIDCPPLSRATLTFLERVSVDRKVRILLTSREGHGRLKRVQDHFGWPVLVQEQEAYLLRAAVEYEDGPSRAACQCEEAGRGGDVLHRLIMSLDVTCILIRI